MKNIFLIILFYLPIIGWTNCPSMDATISASNLNPVAGEEVFFFYAGNDVCNDCSWSITYLQNQNGSVNSNITNSGNFPLQNGDGLGSFVYPTIGSTIVSFTITNNLNGCTETYNLNITIGESECPYPTFTWSGGSHYCLGQGFSPDILYLSSISEISPPSITNIAWDMGDGSGVINSTSGVNNYIYTNPGAYYISAVVSFSNGCQSPVNFDFTNGLGVTNNVSPSVLPVYVDYADPQFSIYQTSTNPNNFNVTYTGNPVFLIPVSPSASDDWQYQLSLDGSIIFDNGFLGDNPIVLSGDLLTTAQNLIPGNYELELTASILGRCPESSIVNFVVSDPPCDTCNSFKPATGEDYWMSAWVHVDEPNQVKSFNPDNVQTDTYIEFEFLGANQTVQFFPTGEIIDGWQRVVGKFTIPAGTLDFAIHLNADNTYATYFDDIRIHPFNSSMKSYVYDGETFWLTSELDDNNYATFYEYDEEGGLIRIKKETSRGIVTIQETRSNTIKKD